MAQDARKITRTPPAATAVPMHLYEEARRRLLSNEPMLGDARSVVAGDLVLAWKSFLRCAVAYVVTAIALDYLPPIRWRYAFAIAAIALVMEILVEIVAASLFGVRAGTWVQLAATAIAYSFTVAASIMVIQKWALR